MSGVPEIPQDQLSVSGAIRTIRSAVVGGNTCYYYQLEGNDQTFSLSVATDERAVILNVGDTVTFTYSAQNTGEIIPVTKLER